MPAVSVLMPVYNRASLVQDAIRSVQNQTFEDWELIILDDGSTDESIDVCKGFEKDGRIRVYTNGKNLGLGETRQRLMSLGSGTYFATHDSDDVSHPRRLEWSIAILEQKPEVGLVAGVSDWIDDDGNVFYKFPELLAQGQQYPQNKKEMVRLLYRNCYVAITACMFRKSFGSFFPGTYRIIDDWYFLLRLANETLVWGIPQVVVTMRRGKNHSHLWKNRVLRIKEIREMMKNMYDFFKTDPDPPIDYKYYRKTLAMWLAEESKFLPNWYGYSSALRSIFYDPLTSSGWNSLWQVSGRAMKKVRNIAVRSTS